MDTSTQPEGNLKMNLNFRRNGNAKAPPITGKISTPDDPETLYSFSAFEHTDKNGEAYWIGPVDMSRSMRQALNTTALQGTHFVAIRENGFKVFKEHADGTPNPAYAKLSLQEQEHEDAKPSFWGTWTRTAEDPQLRLSAWERDPSRYGPWASGNTQYPMTKDEVAAMHSGKPTFDMATAKDAKSSRRKSTANEGRA